MHLMLETPTRKERTTFCVAITPAYDRLIKELSAAMGEMNRSEIVRIALVLLGDRSLSSDWRLVVGLEEEESAA
jgi:hypothetical protein